MRTTFKGYYPPSSEEYGTLWRDGLIILDTNVLLNLYRLPSAAREELFGALKLLKDRIWIPHQVALEFQRRRLTVISSERKSIEDALRSANSLVGDLKSRVEQLQLDKRGLEIDSAKLLANFEAAHTQLTEAIGVAHSAQLDIAAFDPIREDLDQLLLGNVGPGPSTQAELDELIAQGTERYAERIPPGFSDANKERDPTESTLVYDHIRIPRKFGDLIVWRQILNHARKNNTKNIIFVTDDRKDDWWWREHGKTIGPHPELCREIYRETDTSLFWMYSSVQFVEQANRYTKANISRNSVSELQAISENIEQVLVKFENDQHIWKSTYNLNNRQNIKWKYNENKVYAAVLSWISHEFGDIRYNPDLFPDLIVKNERGLSGYEILFVANRQLDTILNRVADIASKAEVYIESGKIAEFNIVIVIENEFLASVIERTEITLANLANRYGLHSIIAGITAGGHFEMFLEIRGDPRRASGPNEND